MPASRTSRFGALIAALALIAAACSSDAEPTTTGPAETDPPAAAAAETATTEAETTTTTTTAETTTTTVVEAPAFDVAAFTSSATEALTEWQGATGAPAVSLSIRLPGQDPINIASGVVDLVTEEPVSTDDYFRIGSITKPMTAAVILQLADEGLVDIDEPMQTYLPGWLDGYEYASEITLRQAMNHTNGLREYAFDPIFYAFAGERLETPFEPEEIEGWLAAQPPLFAPGEQYSYETGGFLSLGRVIEEVTGNTAAEEMRARLFEPAGADAIYLLPQEFPPDPAVTGYARDLLYVAATAIIGQADESGLMINGEPVFGMYDLPQEVLQSSGWTGGGVEAQAESTGAVIHALFDGTILSDAQIAEMTAPALPTTNYGLGISVDEVDGVTVYNHGGGVPGFRSHAAYVVDHDASFAVHASLIPLPDGTDVGVLQDALVPLIVSAVEEISLGS